jgi:Kelch motif protein
MPGNWSQLTSICSSVRTEAYAHCRSWADEGSAQCGRWADEGSNQCSQWADQGHSECSQWSDEGQNECNQWADQGHNECCDWWPCSWACDAFYWVANWVCVGWYWVANWVCQAWYWVANWVCQAWYWVANWVCQAWYWVAKWVCLAWEWVVHIFCFYGNGGPMFLLTDGTVLMNECASGYGTHRWWKLTPDSTGNYVNGLWTRVADSKFGRKYFASAVLADGRLLACGGEYSDVSGNNSQDDTAKSEIYDPVANTWTEIAPPAGVTQIGDSACCLLPDGRFLLGSFNSSSNFIFNPATGNWTNATAKGDSGAEETWVLMPDGTVIVPQCTSAPSAEKYIASTNQWVAAGAVSANLVEAASLEIGPGVLLPDGRAFFVGANSGNTALYQSGAAPANPGTWATGPSLPLAGRQSQGSKDGPGALLPSGTVLFPVAPVDGSANNYLSPCSFFEFDGTNLNRTADPANANCATYLGRMLLIPTGQIIWVREDDDAFYAFTETGKPQDAFRPTVTSVPAILVPGRTVSISGTQFNGLSQAVGYGDDYAAATNYPLVRIRHKESGRVRYCRTSNHAIALAGGSSTSMGVATKAAIVTTQVAVPGDIDRGESELVVVANGIASQPVAVNVSLRGDG